MELIFEIGCEELPARFVDPALEQMQQNFRDRCDDARIDVDRVAVAATPRRLALLVDGLAESQSDLEEERTGPPADIAWDDDGEPTPAAQGFARGQGVDVDDLYTVDTDRGEYVAAEVFEEGAPTTDLLPEILSDIIADIDFPKSMRWGRGDATFGRPVRWIVAVADGEVIPVEFAGVQSSNTTVGHRFSSSGEIAVETVDGYVEKLADADVNVDPARRRTEIVELLDDHGADAGGRVVDDPELVDEVTQLVEKAQAVTLDFSDDYLELPREVLISSMRSHQRYFAIEEDDGSSLRSACVVIYNTPVHDPDVVARGNLKVLRARLDDARFFWDNDRDVALDDHRARLHDVVWIGDLGTIYERTERIGDLAGIVSDAIELDEQQWIYAKRAGLLSKADLPTAMVEEFPDLQGVMGREYALESGENPAVATAIEEQYLPKGANGDLPQTDVGAAVAIAEKLDAIVGCFGVDMIPTSASDPYGLRRAALGILRILRDRNSMASLPDLVDDAIDVYRGDDDATPFEHDDELVADKVVDFLVTRLRYLLDDQAPTDVIQSVLAAGVDDIPSVYGRIEALAELRGEADFEPLALGFKRVVNILQKQADNLDLDALSVDPELFSDPAEEALYDAAHSADSALADHLEQRQWSAACRTLIELKEPVDNFFESVMVMADDDATRHNRLSLLATLRDLFWDVADISKIQT